MLERIQTTNSNELKDFESRTEDSTNSYGDDTPQIIPSFSSIEIIDEVIIVKNN